MKGVYRGHDGGSEEHFSGIASWLVECLQHPRCNRTISGSPIDALSVDLPTRCIEIGQEGLKIKSTAGLRGAYVTLSHRWTTKTATCSTTADNLEERLSYLYMDGWPQAFQDAVTVTRRLGIPYLWIDSLCIIQSGDNGKDWQHEAVRMSQYYQHSIFTIAASNTSERGFLNPHSTGIQEELVRLPYRDRDGVRRGWFYVSKHENPLGVAGKYGADVLNGTLLGRGWILQEWLLSRRILHFLGDQIFFECQSQDPVNDFGEVVRKTDLSDLRLPHQSGHSLEQYSLNSLLAEVTTVSEDFWFRIVQVYSGMKLTKPEYDRVKALAGLAAEARNVLSEARNGGDFEPYLAGCWLRDLKRSLLWEQQDPGPRNILPATAPTWSWIASSNPVHWRSMQGRIKYACELLDVLTAEESENEAYQPPSSPRTEALVAGSYDVDNDFACLVLRGNTALVVNGPALDLSEQQRIARYTGVPSEQTSRWTSIADSINPSEHIGWADVEFFQDLKEMQLQRERQVLLAFHVCTTKIKSDLGVGAIQPSSETYCVLFVTPVARIGPQGVLQCVRAGTGRIYKKDFFQHAEEAIIRLV